MILHPGILALIVGTGLVLTMLVVADAVGLSILRRWDFDSSSEDQLRLERRTYLVSTIVRYALAFEIVAALLFIFTVDDIHELFVGAMCATGSLNANPIGWTALAVKVALVLLAPIWIVADRLDAAAGDYPIIRPKYLGLLALTPLVALDFALQLGYFSGLEPQVITSCCGALFSTEGSGVAGELAALKPVPMMWLFYGTVALFFGVAGLNLARRAPGLRYGMTAVSIVLLVVSLAAVVSFISLYVYQLPTHHCPFDLFQGGYSYVAYPLYGGLFTAVAFGLLPGIFQPLKTLPTLEGPVTAAEPRWITVALFSALLFVVVATWPIVFGEFSLMRY